MRLINTRTLELEEFVGSNIPKYAILSHTWENGEITFQDIQAKPLKNLVPQGALKVIKACKVAAQYGLDYAWVDTCCIDKSSSAELTEAINSMFQWYKLSTICLAYLSDLKVDELIQDGMPKCRWFKRGWTLQELIAPTRIMFYDQGWNERGSKKELSSLLVKITRIDLDILLDPSKIYTIPVGKRMSWAADRQTTRIEDRAYSLLGIFDINMPLIYGEGSKAFTRLQEEIVRRTNDVSIFAWQSRDSSIWRGIFANTPDEFELLSGLQDGLTLRDGSEFFLTNKGLRIDLELASFEANVYLWPLYCTNNVQDEWQCIYLIAVGKDVYARARPQSSILTPRKFLTTVRKHSRYLVEDANSQMSSIVIKSGLHRSFAFPDLLRGNTGYHHMARILNICGNPTMRHFFRSATRLSLAFMC